MKFVEKLSAAGSIDELKDMVHPEAYVAFGSKYESYFEVLANKEYYKSVEEVLFKDVLFIESRTNDEANSAYVFLKAVTGDGAEVNHTFYARLSKSGEWQILHWHAG